MSMHTARKTNYTVENPYLLLVFEYTHTSLPQTPWSKQKYRNFGWRPISTIASINIQCSSIHRYGTCLMTNSSDHNILSFYSFLRTIMIWRFCEGPLLRIKDLVGYKLEWIYALLGVLQYSSRVNERAIKPFLIMVHLSQNKSFLYEVAVEQMHCLHFCDSAKSASLWLQGQLAQTGHTHTSKHWPERRATCKLPTGFYTTKPHLRIIWQSARWE